jgi:dolichyl-phosphate-mannose-protein mannosyltransferase
MAGLDTAVSTGAKLDADLRRRNVPDSRANSNKTNSTEEDVKKSKQVS